ncbi:MAG: HAD-IIA family hydrolase [Propionicimonas sp.]
MSRLIDAYDAAFFDLDGVIYLGPLAVDGATGALDALRGLGKTVMFVTNNAARAAQVVIDHLNSLGFHANDHNVLTSAQVAVTHIAGELPPGSKVLVSGTASLEALFEDAGLVSVQTAAEHPDAVVQGYDPQMTWPRLDEAALAIQAGARWYATNDDSSRPTERGLVPGAGGAIAAVAGTVGGQPTIFGKPFRPMLAEAIRRTGASRPIFVGDRIDTDIVGAVNAGIDSLMVFTGAHGKTDLVATGPGERPTHIGADVRALLAPARTVEISPARVSCRGQVAEAHIGKARLGGSPTTLDTQLDALWAITQLVWADPDLDSTESLASLGLVP